MIIILVLMIFFPLMAACCLFLSVLLDITKMQRIWLNFLMMGLQRRQEQNKTERERERLYHEKKMVIFFPFQFMDELVYYIEIEIPPAN